MNGFQTVYTSGDWRCRRSYGVPTTSGRQQQQQQQRGRRRGQEGARTSSDNFRGVGIGNSSRGYNLGRL